jgi:hypothetical protein
MRQLPKLGLLLLLSAVAAPCYAQATAPAAAPAAETAASIRTGIDKDSGWSIRPLVGTFAAVGGPPSPTAQLLIGVDFDYKLSTPTSIIFGALGATGEDFISAEAHVDFKYRFFNLSPLVVPNVSGGLGFVWGFPRGAYKNKSTTSGLGARLGTGISFLATPTVIPGFQVIFEFGPRFLPNTGILAEAQVILGVTFVL